MVKKAEKNKVENPKFTWTWETKDFNGRELWDKMIQFHGPGIGDTSMFLNLSKSHADMILMYFDKIYQLSSLNDEKDK